MIRDNKRGQSSLEFLMTYGWAIMVIGVVFGAMIYFGISTPTQVVPESCLFEQSILCNEFQSKVDPGDDYMLVIIDNNVGLPINITGVSLDSMSTRMSNCEVDSYYDHLTDTQIDGANPLTVGTSGTAQIRLECSPATFLTKGDTVRTDIEIKYEIDRPGYFPKTATGTVVSKVVE